jgi:hypothetical protein
MPKLFHIVCEGPTDYEVFKALAKEIGTTVSEKYKCQKLFPPKDKDIGGWSNVKIWLKQQESARAGNQLASAMAQDLGSKHFAKGSIRPRDKIGSALAIAQSKIIIQLDSDIACDSVVLKDAGKSASLLPLHPKDRLSICEAALRSWLGPHYSAFIGSSIYLCINSLAIENWILAAHSLAELGGAKIMEGCDFDSIHHPDEVLVSIGFPQDKGKLRKTAGAYRNHATLLVNNLTIAKANSSSLNKFCTDLVLL